MSEVTIGVTKTVVPGDWEATKESGFIHPSESAEFDSAVPATFTEGYEEQRSKKQTRVAWGSTQLING